MILSLGMFAAIFLISFSKSYNFCSNNAISGSSIFNSFESCCMLVDPSPISTFSFIFSNNISHCFYAFDYGISSLIFAWLSSSLTCFKMFFKIIKVRLSSIISCSEVNRFVFDVLMEGFIRELDAFIWRNCFFDSVYAVWTERWRILRLRSFIVSVFFSILSSKSFFFYWNFSFEDFFIFE